MADKVIADCRGMGPKAHWWAPRREGENFSRCRVCGDVLSAASYSALKDEYESDERAENEQMLKAEAEHNIPGVGKLGESIEQHEAARIKGLAAAGPQPPVPTKPRSELPAKGEILAAKAVVREMLQDLRGEMTLIQGEIHASNDLLRHIDVPLEQVADSHERATHSFETLRADIRGLTDEVAALTAVCRSIQQELRRK